MDFEARKDAMRLFGTVLRVGPQLGADGQVIEYVRTHPRISELLLEGSSRPEVFSLCAQMLRSCMRYPELVAFLHDQKAMSRLIDLARHQSFDVSSEAFSSLRELLLAHKAVTAGYLEAHFAAFFGQFNALLQADDYVTQRQALRLLSEVLLDRSFMQVRVEYVGNDMFLQIHMNLLRDKSKAIQLEAFHVFKIFVANPNKPYRVQQILFRNKVRLAKLLEAIGVKRESEKALTQDLKTVVSVLQAMGPPVSPCVASVVAPANEVVMVA
uniref:Calcium-binding protein 39 n=1 Tax=Alexandrium andersonii TaxID=327968 RepID=A0A7S2J6Y7_9DINO